MMSARAVLLSEGALDDLTSNDQRSWSCASGGANTSAIYFGSYFAMEGNAAGLKRLGPDSSYFFQQRNKNDPKVSSTTLSSLYSGKPTQHSRPIERV
jgi:hypothetical protein